MVIPSSMSPNIASTGHLFTGLAYELCFSSISVRTLFNRARVPSSIGIAARYPRRLIHLPLASPFAATGHDEHLGRPAEDEGPAGGQ